MRILKGGLQLNVLRLGQIPEFKALHDGVMSLDLMSADTLTNEQVFAGTHRLTAANSLNRSPQKHSSGGRSDALAELVKTQVQHLELLYPGTTPVLIQCATLPPRSELLWHVDSYLYQNVSHKIHLAISTNQAATYQCKDVMGIARPYHFNEGAMYEINNILLHRSVNHGETPRTHVIIDLMSKEQLNKFTEEGTDFFFTHHPENRAREKHEA